MTCSKIELKNFWDPSAMDNHFFKYYFIIVYECSNDDCIIEYDNLDFGKTWFFDKKKIIVKYFNDYIMFVIFGETESSLQTNKQNR